MVAPISDCDHRRPWPSPRQALRPLDRGDAARGEIAIETDLIKISRLQSIQVDVNQRQTAATVLMHQREGWTGDFARIDPQALSESANKRGLARAEISGEQQYIARLEIFRECNRDRTRLRF